MTERAPLGQILRVWLTLGFQSFGGGAATLALIQRAVVDRRGWMTEEEFARDWALCQITPGINLLGLTILIGRRLAGGLGVGACLLGLLLPSVTITVLLTAFYGHYRDLPAVRAAVRGVIPATAGLGLATAWGLARPLLAASRRESYASLALGVALLAGSGVAAAFWHPPVVLLLCGAGLAGAAFRWRRDVPR